MRRFTVLTISLAVVVTMAGVDAAWAKVPGANGRILYSAEGSDEGEGGSFTIDPDGSARRQVLDGGCRWSPDGMRIALTVETAHGRRPATMAADGSDLVVLDATTAAIDLICGAWSADGRIAAEGFSDADPMVVHGIYTMRATDGTDGSDLRFVAAGACPCDYSPDGSQLVFLGGSSPAQGSGTSHRDYWQLFVVNVDGTGLHAITPPDFVVDSGESWSPDGRWILLHHPGGDLYLVHPDGTGLRQIAFQGAGKSRFRAFGPGWSPDGMRIVFSMFIPGVSPGDLYTSRPDGSDLRQVTNTPDLNETSADWGASTG